MTNVLNTLTNEQLTAVNELVSTKLQEGIAAAVQQAMDSVQEQMAPILEENEMLKAQLSKEPIVLEGTVVDEPVITTPAKVDVTDDIEGLFNAIQTRLAIVVDGIIVATKEGDQELVKTLEKEKAQLTAQANKLSRKFPQAQLFTKYRNATAEALRKSAGVTRKYGHGFVDVTMNLVNDITSTVFVVVDAAVDGTKKIVTVASNTTRKLGHFTVEQAAVGQEVAANFIEVK